MRPLREGSLVQRHAHGVPLLHRSVKETFHGPVGPNGLGDAPATPALGVQVYRPGKVSGRVRTKRGG